MRICHVIECGATGALEMVLLMAEIQRAAGHRVLIVYSPRPGTPGDLRARVNTDVQLARVDMRPLALRLAGWRRRFSRLLRDWKPDVLHFHGARAGFMGRLAAGRRFRRRALYSPHCISLMHLDRTRFEHALFRALERFANRVCESVYVACCEPERTVVSNEIGADVVLLENAVDDGLAPPDAKRRAGGPARVVTCSRISASKDPGLFADICRAVRAVRPEIEFRWIGDGDPRRRGTLEEAGVTVTGWMTREDALREVAGGWVYLSTSAWEGLPVSLLEAMLLKVPVLCRRAGWSEAVLRDGETGRMFDDAAAAAAVLTAENSEWLSGAAEEAWTEAKRRYSQARFAADLAQIYDRFEAGV